MRNKSKSDQNLLKLKVALAAGGLMTTLIGAGLLGSSAQTETVNSVANTEAATTTTSTGTAIEIDSTLPEALDLNLEAIPTVAAPTVSNVRVATSRSSG